MHPCHKGRFLAEHLNKNGQAMRWFIIWVSICLPFMALAQDDDPMAVQRCVWACLANSPGAASAQYDQCVRARCMEQPAVPSATDWRAGLTSNGSHHFAGIDAEQGYEFYYFCNAAERYFALVGLPVSAGEHRLVIGNVAYQVPFDRRRGDLTVDLPATSVVGLAMRAGGMMDVQSLNGQHVIRFSLRGATRALQRTASACAS